MNLRTTLTGAVVMAPMTKGSNLPYRRLCVELGAVVTMSEMAVARRLKQRRQGEYALIRRFEDEPCFGVQLAGKDPAEMAWAAGLAQARGAAFIDVNLGCPIDAFTRKGLGAALARRPRRVAEIVSAMKRALPDTPVTVKIRLGWDDGSLNYLELARAVVDAGADGITVHGRTRNARYRQAANWDAVGEVVAAVPVPVIGNGDLLFPHEIEAARARSGCAGVMAARGVLIKPWLFTEAREGRVWDIDAEARVGLYRRYVELAVAHWGDDEHGRSRVREFLRWHLAFWCRYRPPHRDGTLPTMQTRDTGFEPRTPLEALLARADDPALDYVCDRLMDGAPVDPSEAPAPDDEAPEEERQVEG